MDESYRRVDPCGRTDDIRAVMDDVGIERANISAFPGRLHGVPFCCPLPTPGTFAPGLGTRFTHRRVEGGHLTHQREEKRVDGRRVDFGRSWTGPFQHSSSLLDRPSMQVRPHAIAASISFVVMGPRGLV